GHVTGVQTCALPISRIGQPDLVLRATGAKALAAMVRGDLAAAEAFANELLPHAAEMGFALLYYGSIVIAVRAHQGRGGEIREVRSEERRVGKGGIRR